jgi:hypothetical protein
MMDSVISLFSLVEVKRFGGKTLSLPECPKTHGSEKYVGASRDRFSRTGDTHCLSTTWWRIKIKEIQNKTTRGSLKSYSRLFYRFYSQLKKEKNCWIRSPLQILGSFNKLRLPVHTMEGGYRLEVINGELQNVSNVLEPRSTTTSSSSSSGLLLCDSHTSISMREKHTNRIILDDHRVRHDCPNSTMTFLQRQNYDLRNADAVSNRSEGSAEEASPSSVNVVTKPFLSNLNSLRHALSILNNHSTDLKQAMNVTSAGPPTQRPPPPPATRIACRARGMPDDHSFQVCTTSLLLLHV